MPYPDQMRPVFQGLQPTGRMPFGQSSLEILAAFNRNKVMVNSFQAAIDSSIGVVGADALRLVRIAVGAPAGPSQVTAGSRTASPYFGMSACTFTGATNNGAGSQWTQGVADFGTNGPVSYKEPFDIVWMMEFASQTPPANGAGFAGLVAPTGLPMLFTDGNLDGSGAQGIGFWMQQGGLLHAVVGDPSANVGPLAKPLGISVIEDKPMTLAMRYHLAGFAEQVLAGFFRAHPDTEIEYFVDGHLVRTIRPYFDAPPNAACPEDITTGLTLVRTPTPGANHSWIVPYWAMGFAVRDSIHG